MPLIPEVRAPIHTQTMLQRITAMLLLALASACATYSPDDSLSGGVPSSTLLALSPDGRSLVAAWPESGVMRAELLRFDGLKVTSRQPIRLPGNATSMRWSRSPDEILVAALNGQQGELLRLNVSSGLVQVIYRSKTWIRYPIETEMNAFAFLEATEPGGRYSRWQKLSGGVKKPLDTKIYSMAAPLEQVGQSLHLLEPTKKFRQFNGVLPAGMNDLITPTTWALKCADTETLTCLRTHNLADRAGRFVGALELVHGARVICSIGDRWIDEREIQISSDGRTVAFHGGAERNARRLVYLANTSENCATIAVLPAPLGSR